MRAPATYPDEPEPEPYVLSRTVRVCTGDTVTSFDWPPYLATFVCTMTTVAAGPVFVEVEYR